MLIYNFHDLRSELEIDGYTFQGEPDTEVLLCLFSRCIKSGGLDNSELSALLRRLNGIFAFALWDADHNSLLLVRDALGVKPLYYQLSPIGLHFSSEIKALPEMPMSLDVSALDRYLTYLWCPDDATPAKQVRTLCPGEALFVSDGLITERFTWYQLPVFHRSAVKSASMPEVQAIRGTESHLRQAVHRQMIADVPVGAFLSGGLDSSSVVAFARERNPDLRCFTIDVIGAGDEGFCNHLLYARRVANHLALPLKVV